ncbi:hypothetical protein M3P05_16410 [Sansalvadorimonas sp. 2012CJ34-2]|uniref:Tetratricopeptide repeat protein n=1 Tax=Parendozoicomonas callyspongiae TaxID=2942213 RepID=A0ABT0PJG7_9GAMM|nr:hypothetical protein [Sansalvadorimonas sp. 2012CJ34-2]MCL6271503.1 hypothetical protein [Sansalvadorimonas sp. 2012CJ34-2]
MERWQTRIRQGNFYFQHSCWKQAEHYYREAASILEEEWFRDLDNAQFMMAWIACMHNLGTLFEKLEEPQKASPFFVLPYRRVVTLLQEGGLSQEFHFPLMRAVRSTVLPLLEFSNRHSVCDCCRKHLDIAREWLAVSMGSSRQSCSVSRLSGSVASGQVVPFPQARVLH